MSCVCRVSRRVQSGDVAGQRLEFRLQVAQGAGVKSSPVGRDDHLVLCAGRMVSEYIGLISRWRPQGRNLVRGRMLLLVVRSAASQLPVYHFLMLADMKISLDRLSTVRRRHRTRSRNSRRRGAQPPPRAPAAAAAAALPPSRLAGLPMP